MSDLLSAGTSAESTPADLFHDVTAVISQLVVYPVKSCAGVSVNEAILTDTGLEFDRSWMVVDADGNFLTQRELPRLALVQPQLRYYDLVLRAPGMLALHIALDQVEAPAIAHMWGESVAAYDMGGTAAQWFSDFLGVTARLVRFDPDHPRVCSPKWTGDVRAFSQFSDGFSVLVLSQASLDQFNEKLVAAGQAAVGMDRFRPNLVIGHATGADAVLPHDEDRLESLQVTTPQGDVTLHLVKPCPRCPIPNVDQATGISSPVVGDMLQSYRADPRLDGALTFGMNAVVNFDKDHLLKVGQAVGGRYRFG